MNTAVVIIDMQPFFFRTKERRVKYNDLITNINKMISFAEKNKMRIYHVKTIHKKDRSTWNLVMKKHDFVALLEGSEESKIIDEINLMEHHEVVIKTRQSSFIKTDFEKRLRDSCIDTLIIGGVFTHGCVGRTAIDAYENDFNVILASDCSFSHLKDQEKVMFDVILKEQEQLIMTNQEIFNYLNEKL